MGDVAYTIEQAAASIEANVSDIVQAVRDGHLRAYVLREKVLILREDMPAAVRALNSYRVNG